MSSGGLKGGIPGYITLETDPKAHVIFLSVINNAIGPGGHIFGLNVNHVHYEHGRKVKGGDGWKKWLKKGGTDSLWLMGCERDKSIAGCEGYLRIHQFGKELYIRFKNVHFSSDAGVGADKKCSKNSSGIHTVTWKDGGNFRAKYQVGKDKYHVLRINVTLEEFNAY